MATAKGLAQGLNKPLVSIPTLLLSLSAGRLFRINSTGRMPRKMRYTALFRFSGVEYQQVEDDQAINPQLWAEKLADYGSYFITGDGATIYADVWQESRGKGCNYFRIFNWHEEQALLS